MPFPDLITQGLKALEDSKYFKDTPQDAALKKDMEGGLLVTRKRFTRPPARILVTGFTMISLADKALFDAYWNSHAGGSVSFTYTHPLTAETLTVRFDDVYTTAYTGIGTAQMWDLTDIKLRTV